MVPSCLLILWKFTPFLGKFTRIRNVGARGQKPCKPVCLTGLYMWQIEARTSTSLPKWMFPRPAMPPPAPRALRPPVMGGDPDPIPGDDCVKMGWVLVPKTRGTWGPHVHFVE